MEEKNSTTSGITTFATLAGALLAIATIIGFLLHGCGHVAAVTYLDMWGLDESFSPQSADLNIISGYNAILTLGSDLLNGFPWSFAVGSFIGTAIIVLIIRTPKLEAKENPKWFQKIPRLAQEILISLIISALGMYTVAALLLAGFFVFLLPGYFGERAGKLRAIEKLSAIKSDSPRGDIELWLGDQRILRGILIASTEKTLAVYDRDRQSVRTVSRDGIEVRVSMDAIELRQKPIPKVR